MRVLAALFAAGALAGCSGDDKGAVATSTDVQTVTVTEPTSTGTSTAAAPDRAGSLADAVALVLNHRTQ
jgi:ABC-type glycerol-3-phosphate transport system substrate-binding protein